MPAKKGARFPDQKRLSKYRRDPKGYGRFDFTENDLAILGYIHEYRYVRAGHLYALMPGNDRHLASRLQGLFHHGFVARLVPMVRMRLSEDDAGSPAMVYILDQRGAEELARSRGVGLRELPWRRPEGNLQWFVEHHTGISDFHGAVELALRRRPDLHLAEWRQDAELRDWTKIGSQTYRVAPDGYLGVVEGVERDENGEPREGKGTRRNFFLEIDRGTEEPSRLYRRFEDYAWYLRSKTYEESYVRKHPEDVRVLFVAPDEERVTVMLRELHATFDAIRDYEKQHGYHRDPKWRSPQLAWFWFTTADRYDLKKPARVLDPIWRKGKNADARVALFK